MGCPVLCVLASPCAFVFLPRVHSLGPHGPCRPCPAAPRPLPTRRRLSRSLALSSLNKHTEAVAYYKKALELDPDNETYKSNLKIAELKLRETPSPVSGPGKGAGGSREVCAGFHGKQGTWA